MPFIATAGWSIPGTVAGRFAQEGSGLSRYASVFSGVEINSTFYRRHQEATFARWAEAVPRGFRFAVKMPRTITHESAMKDVGEGFALFLQDISPLADKRGPLLCQLPPSLAFDAERMDRAFATMRWMDQGIIVIEARHGSWAGEEALALLDTYSLRRVLADPAPVWPVETFDDRPFYVRLHGKPKVYHSSYTAAEITAFAELLAPGGWVRLRQYGGRRSHPERARHARVRNVQPG